MFELDSLARLMVWPSGRAHLLRKLDVATGVDDARRIPRLVSILTTRFSWAISISGGPPTIQVG